MRKTLAIIIILSFTLGCIEIDEDLNGNIDMGDNKSLRIQDITYAVLNITEVVNITPEPTPTTTPRRTPEPTVTETPTAIPALYLVPDEYNKHIKTQISDEVGLELLGYGGSERMGFKSVYFIMYYTVDWKTYRFWAVEVTRDTAKIIKYQEIDNDGCSDQLGQCPNLNQIWWIPRR